ncbi:MAG: hypothetical protein ACLP8S_05460 [Solirubrobacteraceae bacterium]
MPEDKVEFRFPTKRDEVADWQGKVQAAIAAGTLSWSETQDSGEWVLDGTCPRCKHQMSQLVVFDVILPDTFGGAQLAASTATADAVDVEVVCNCSGEHKKDTAGCGFGRGIPVNLQRPKPA